MTLRGATLSTPGLRPWRARWAVAPIALTLAAAVAALAPVQPLLALAAGLGLVVVALTTLGRNLAQLSLIALAVLLIGYAFMGKGFAWVGVSPLFVSEPVLGVTLLAFVTWGRPARMTTLHFLLFAFIGWGVLRTVPFVGFYAFDALRDAVVWLYVFFALAVAQFMTRARMESAIRLYGMLLLPFAIWVPISGVMDLLGILRFSWPGAPVALLTFKPPDMAVHLAGVSTFVMLGLYTARGLPMWARESVLWPAWAAGAFVAAAASRGGMLALLVTVPLTLLTTRAQRKTPLVLIGGAAVAALFLINPSFEGSGARPVTPQGFALNFMSIFSDDVEEGSRGDNKEWRLNWWEDIVDYTIDGPFFLGGKGFGVNLADDGGYQTTGELRSPHSIHMTVLARMGVPGLALWIAIHATFGTMLIRSLLRARRRGDRFWAAVDGWLLAYWAAMLVNASFDVYLEGPQGGIWFWTVFGLGMAAMRLQREEEPEAPRARVAPWPPPPLARVPQPARAARRVADR